MFLFDSGVHIVTTIVVKTLNGKLFVMSGYVSILEIQVEIERGIQDKLKGSDY